MDIGEIQAFFPEITGLEEKKIQLHKIETELHSLQSQIIERAREKDRHGSWTDPYGESTDVSLNPSYQRLGELIEIVNRMQLEIKCLETSAEAAKKAFTELQKEVEKKQETEWNSPISSISLDD